VVGGDVVEAAEVVEATDVVVPAVVSSATVVEATDVVVPAVVSSATVVDATDVVVPAVVSSATVVDTTTSPEEPVVVGAPLPEEPPHAPSARANASMTPHLFMAAILEITMTPQESSAPRTLY
jgi:hypothetical protein